MREIRAVVAETLRPAAAKIGVVLAVSGGIDSMVLLDAAAETLPHVRMVVATFDHATGRAAARASAFVVERAAALGVEWVRARARSAATSEAALREARWTFLRRVAARGRTIVTAHTRDDQVETVLMRTMRGAGARGLAGLYARTSILRPLLGFARTEISDYAEARKLEWIEDPSNASSRYLRNRLRHILLPALRAVRPTVDAELLLVADRAAQWRAEVDEIVDRMIGERPGTDAAVGSLDIPAAPLMGHATSELSVLWPAMAARCGLALDRRAMARLARFTQDGRVGSRIQLAGGWDVVRSRAAFQLRRRLPEPLFARELPPSRATRWGRWTFCPSNGGGSRAPRSVPRDPAWSATLPTDKPLTVRGWRAGDAMAPKSGARPRKVKRLLSAAGVTGHERTGWPVVLAGDEIVWIPGVQVRRCASAQPDQSGLAFVCERFDG